jgi:hypothetical protein
MREQWLGHHHPETAQTLHDFALFHQKQGNLSEAHALAECACLIRLQLFGEDHAQTLASRALLASLEKAGEVSQDGSSCSHGAQAYPDPDHQAADLVSQKTPRV